MTTVLRPSPRRRDESRPHGRRRSCRGVSQSPETPRFWQGNSRPDAATRALCQMRDIVTRPVCRNRAMRDLAIDNGLNSGARPQSRLCCFSTGRAGQFLRGRALQVKLEIRHWHASCHGLSPYFPIIAPNMPVNIMASAPNDDASIGANSTTPILMLQACFPPGLVS